MKILKLRFKNINSLRGPYEIDFTSPSYARGGLFAIVGPTGSGKTSILDAVSFALFGVTPRTEGSVVTANEDEEKSVLVTRGEKECEASVVFEVEGVCWLSRCRMRLVKSNGKSVELVRLSSPDAAEGEIITKKVREWEQKISELLGMSFPAFTRTVLLAQGAFGRFLTAKPQDRAEILERVTGSEIYARIGSAVYRRWSEADRTAAEAMSKLETLEFLTDEDRAREEAVLRDYESLVETIRRAETGLRACRPVPGRTEERVWEFWPSDLQALFLRAGVVKPPPPPFSPECGPEASVQPGRPPRIITPKDGVVYQRRLSDPERSGIPLVASTDADASAVFWFVKDRFIGRGVPGEPLVWHPGDGAQMLRVVDNLGRAAMQKIVVRTLP